MTVLHVRHHDASIQVVVKLTRFIADWPAAQQQFIGGIADGFRDWLPISARSFSVTPALALDDLRCRCQLFGGACSIILAPDTLRLDFMNVRQRDQPEVIETVRRSLDWLAAALGENGRDWMSFNTSAHMQAPDSATVDAYLGQFVPEDVDSILQMEPGARYLPSARMMCSGENGRWILRRVVEKSTVIDDGVYVDTRIDIRNPDPVGIGGHVELLARLDRLADSVVGLQPEDG
ncbi:MAG: hypothetical protein OXF27_12715 [Acidobacteria bacterium]|nr:hypothetical protein [Acidobacteriota bacterium]